MFAIWAPTLLLSTFSFQPLQLCTQIKIMRALEDDTDYKHKTLTKADLELVETDEAGLRQSLKDRQHGSGIFNVSLADG